MTAMTTGHRRAAVCIGVDRVGGLDPLTAAASGAAAMAEWAHAQGCTVALHTDLEGPVHRRDVLATIKALVDERIYDQLIVYFAGHGLLSAPGVEVWLLSDATADSTEAISAFLTAEHARGAGIPHVVLVSDACRSYAAALPLVGVTGGSVFPTPGGDFGDCDIDLYFATRPGNPAYEVREAGQSGHGIFTRCLLDVIAAPPRDIIEYLEPAAPPGAQSTAVPVVTSRALRDPVARAVADAASLLDPLLDQRPQIRAEADLPQYFAVVGDGARAGEPHEWADNTAAMEEDPGPSPFGVPPPEPREIDRLASFFDYAGSLAASSGYDWYREVTPAYIAVRGAAVAHVTVVGWELFDQRRDGADGTVLALVPAYTDARPGRATDGVLQFGDGTATLVSVVPGRSTAVVVDRGAVVAMDYGSVPGPRQAAFGSAPGGSEPGADRGELAYRTAMAIDGEFPSEDLRPRSMSYPWGEPYDRATGVLTGSPSGASGDPALGTLRAYAAAERGRFDPEVVFAAKRAGLVTFDIALLATRSARGNPRVLRAVEEAFAFGEVHPFAPLLTRGWTLLADDSELATPAHAALSATLIPALYTTFTPDGAELAHRAALGEDIT